MSEIEKRLEAMGFSLPSPWSPRGTFLPWRTAGSTIYLSGQICERDGAVILEGPVGVRSTVGEARKAAQICALNLLYCIKQACGNLDNVEEVTRLGGFVNCVAGFPDSPKVIDGASELFIELYGDAGRHARTAVGVTGLPGNAAVEVDAVVQVIR